MNLILYLNIDKKFIILTGYKHQEIYKYFKKKNYSINYLNKKNQVKNHKNKISINFLYTGQKTNKLQRLLKVKEYIKNEKFFFLTYGDGLSNINLKKLLSFHKSKKGACTLSAINPQPRFGLLKIKKDKIIKFEEKKLIKNNYVNGGFFVCNFEIFKYCKNESNYDFEENLLSDLANKGKLNAYKHHKFWYSMDTLRDKHYLNKLFKEKNAPWL